MGDEQSETSNHIIEIACMAFGIAWLVVGLVLFLCSTRCCQGGRGGNSKQTRKTKNPIKKMPKAESKTGAPVTKSKDAKEIEKQEGILSIVVVDCDEDIDNISTCTSCHGRPVNERDFMVLVRSSGDVEFGYDNSSSHSSDDDDDNAADGTQTDVSTLREYGSDINDEPSLIYHDEVFSEDIWSLPPAKFSVSLDATSVSQKNS